MIVQVTEGQTIYDLGLTYYGTVDGAFKIAQDNRSVIGSLDDRLPAGTELFIDETTVFDQNVVDVYVRRNERANTGDEPLLGQMDDSFDESFLI